MAFDADILSIQYQKSVSRILNQTVLDFAQANASECSQKARQALQIVVQRNSSIDVSGDFRLEQEATLALACMQRQSNSSELIQNLQAEIEKELSQKAVTEAVASVSYGATQIQISDAEVKNIIDNTIKLNNNAKCIASVEQNGSIIVTDGSKISVGQCNVEQLKAARDICLAPSDVPISASDRSANCNFVKECGGKANLFFKQLVGLTGSCDQLQQIASSFSQSLAGKVNEKLGQTNETKGLGNVLIWVAVIVGLLIIFAVIFLIVKNSLKKDAAEIEKKKKQAQSNQYGYGGRSGARGSEYEPVIGGNPYYT